MMKGCQINQTDRKKLFVDLFIFYWNAAWVWEIYLPKEDKLWEPRGTISDARVICNEGVVCWPSRVGSGGRLSNLPYCIYWELLFLFHIAATSCKEWQALHEPPASWFFIAEVNFSNGK